MTEHGCPTCAELEPGQLCDTCRGEWETASGPVRLGLVANAVLSSSMVAASPVAMLLPLIGGPERALGRVASLEPEQLRGHLLALAAGLVEIAAPASDPATAAELEAARSCSDAVLANLLRGLV